MKKTPKSKALIIGDAHVDEQQELDRFENLGHLIKEEQPTHIIIIGDFLSINSLSAWDKNKRKAMEGRRYNLEIDAGNAALDMMLAPMIAMNKERAKQRRKQYKPIIIFIEGNHEDRVTRYLEIDPVMEGTISVPKDLRLAERGIQWVPYKSNYNLNGVSFTHIPIMSNGRAISNPNVAQKALKLYHNSVVFGHTHTLDIAGEHRQNSPHLNQALAVGCFFEHVDEYAKGSMTNYWRGLVMLDMYSPNRYDIRTIAMRQLKEDYNG